MLFMSDEFREKIFVLGERLGFTRDNLYKMCQRGIPAKHHYAFMDEAKNAGIELTRDELKQNSPEYANTLR